MRAGVGSPEDLGSHPRKEPRPCLSEYCLPTVSLIWSGPAPGRLCVWMVLHRYALARQLVADPVRGREIPGGARLVPLGDQGFYLRLGDRCAAPPQVEVGGRQIGQADGEHLVEVARERGEVRTVEPVIAGGGDDRRERPRRVEVIGHRAVEGFKVASRRRARSLTWAAPPGRKAVEQPPEAGLRAVHHGPAELGLAAVMSLQQQVTVDQRVVAAVDHVANDNATAGLSVPAHPQ